jgi:hypothetical protein
MTTKELLSVLGYEAPEEKAKFSFELEDLTSCFISLDLKLK